MAKDERDTQDLGANFRTRLDQTIRQTAKERLETGAEDYVQTEMERARAQLQAFIEQQAPELEAKQREFEETREERARQREVLEASLQSETEQRQQEAAGARGTVTREDRARQAAPRRLQALERRRYRSRAAVLLGLTLILGLLSSSVLHFYAQPRSAEPRFRFFSQDLLAEQYPIRGLIVRDETVYASPLVGIARPLQTEGSKVAVGESMAMLLNPRLQLVYEKWTEVARAQAERRLELLNSGVDSAAVEESYKHSEQEIRPWIDLLRQDARSANLRHAASVHRSIEAVLYRRNQELSHSDFHDPVLEQLSRSARTLEEQLASLSTQAQASDSGYISFMMDGQEERLTPDFLENISGVELEQLYAQGNQYYNISRNLSEGQPVYRISHGPNHYFALYSDQLPAWAEEERPSIFSIYLPQAKVTVENCVLQSYHYNEKTGRSILVCRSDSQVAELLDQRVLSGFLVTGHSYGYRVPLSALTGLRATEQGQEARIMVVSQGRTSYVDVRIVATDETFATIEALDKEGRSMITEGGVYVENPEYVQAGISIG